MSPSPSVVPLWINGQQRLASDGRTFEVQNPHDQRVVTVAASASKEDCDAAVCAAGRALQTWEQTPAAAKRAIFLHAADLLTTDVYKNKIAAAVQEETAAVATWAMLNVMGSAVHLRETAQLTGKLSGENWPSASPGAMAIVQRRPIGVIFAMAPWNAPVSLAIRAICVPIICGNTVILKSSEHSPRSQVIVAEVLHEAGLPPGVLNFISVSREDTPKMTAQIIGHPLVRKINFTGSDTVGKIIALEAAKYLKPCVFELGGKAPAVVLNDADVDEAAKSIVFGGMSHSGQICMSTERVIVQREVAPRLIASLLSLAGKLKAGDPSTDMSAHLSCLFTEESAKKVSSILVEAKQEGAEFLLGDGSRSGSIVQPHVLTGARPGMRAWDKESFGPMIVIAEVDAVDEAIEMANASEYSLSASLWTNNMDIALSVAQSIRAGAVAVNGSTISIEPQFGNAGLGGSSGYGRFDVDDWTNKRLIVLHPPNSQTLIQAQFSNIVP